MKNYFENFLEEYDYPVEARAVLLSAYEKLSAENEFWTLIENYYNYEKSHEYKYPLHSKMMEKFRKNKEVIEPLCEGLGINSYTGFTVFYICVSKETKNISKKWKWTEDMYKRGMADIKCKLLEGYGHSGNWGVTVTSWISYILDGVMNSIGRLQFFYKEHDGEAVTIAGRTLKTGESYIDIHIPASKESFGKEARLDAYDKACKYFCELYGKDVCFFGCKSWLLFEHNREILDEKSNIVSFMNDFRITESRFYENNRQELWRIFGDEAAKGELENLPENSSLQRSYKKWLLDGNFPGEGKGFFVYDGENKKILN